MMLSNSSSNPAEEDPAFYYWFVINSSTGVITINPTFDNQTGQFNLSLFVEDQSHIGESRPFYYTINATKSGFNDNVTVVNLTQSLSIVLTLTDTEYPQY